MRRTKGTNSGDESDSDSTQNTSGSYRAVREWTLTPQADKNGVRCAQCVEFYKTRPGRRPNSCANCHHFLQAHGTGPPTRITHSCPPGDDDDDSATFSCTDWTTCPTSYESKHKSEIKDAKDKSLKKHSFISQDLASNLDKTQDPADRKKILNTKLDNLRKHAFGEVQKKLEKKRQADFYASDVETDDDDEVYVRPVKRKRTDNHDLPVEDLKPEDIKQEEEWCHTQLQKYNLRLAMLELKKKSIKSETTTVTTSSTITSTDNQLTQ